MLGKLFVLAALLAAVFAAEWQVVYPNVMTVAIGVSAPDTKRVYVSGGDNGSGASILKSADAGATWTSLPHDLQMMYLDVDMAPGSDFGVAGCLGFWGQTAVGSWTNDGDVFQAIPFEPLFSASQSVSAIDGGYFVVGFWLASVRDEPVDGIISSVDGGQTISYHPWGGNTQARYGSFPSNTTWFISGGTWPAEKRSIHGPRQINHRIEILNDGAKVSFNINLNPITEKNGYIGVIRKSVDGGATFQTVFNETGRFYFNGIDCTDENNCWVVAEGPEGAFIFRTSDGGNTWVEQTFLAGDSLLDVQMLNENEGWAVGGDILSNSFNAIFLHTLDGGKTWTMSNTIAHAYPNAITVVDSNTAYASAFLRSGLSSILGYK